MEISFLYLFELFLHCFSMLNIGYWSHNWSAADVFLSIYVDNNEQPPL